MPLLITNSVIAPGEQLTFHYAGGDNNNDNDNTGSAGDVGSGGNGDSNGGVGNRSYSDESKKKRHRTCHCGSSRCTGLLPHSGHDNDNDQRP